MSTDVAADVSLSEKVAEEIRVVMARRQIRQSHLARQIGTNEQWLSVRLRGVQPIDVNDLAEIAAALGVTVTDLIPRDGFAIGRRHRKLRTSAYALTRVIDRDRPQTSGMRPSTYGTKRGPAETRQGAFTRRRGAAI